MLRFDRLNSAIQSIVDWAHLFTSDINTINDLFINDVPDFPSINYLGIEQEFYNNTSKLKDPRKIEKEYNDRLFTINKIDLSSYKDYFGSKEFELNNIDEYMAVVNYDINDNSRDIHFEFYSQRIAGLMFEFDKFIERINSLISNYLNNKVDFKSRNEYPIRFETDLSEDDFKSLYKILTQELDAIDEYETTEYDFLNVFTKEFNSHDSKIFFTYETKQIAYLFSLLRNKFKKLENTIGISMKFISKLGKPITRNNLYKSLSSHKFIEAKDTKIIEKIINRFLNQ